MRLITEKGELTLPSDFSFEIEQNSAFFSEDGAASVSASIPATTADQAKLGFPNRIARKNRFINAFPAILSKGVFQKKGMLVVATATEDTITCSMALDDSEFYTKHKDQNLKEIFAGKVLTTYTTPLAWSQWLLSVYKGQTTFSDFRLVPVAVNYDEETGSYQVNNEPDNSGSGIWNLKHEPRSVTEGGSLISVPEGYGLVPFLTLDAFFRELFSLLGYTVDLNCFASHEILQNLILLHNCSDVVCNGKIDYSDLVPSCSVADILEWMQQKFHAQIAVHPENNSVDIHLLEDILSGHSEHDLSSEIIGNPTFTFGKSSRVIISPDTSLDGAAPAADTLQDLLAKYGGYSDLSEAQWAYAGVGTLAHRLSTGDFYEVKTDSKVRIGSNYFKYDRQNSDASEEFSPEDLMPPMVFVNGILMPYIGERKHRNTSYNNSQKDADQDIIIADYAGLSSTGHYNYATTQKYDDAGVIRTGKQGLNAEDIYFQFWKRYGYILLNNSIEVSGEFNLTIEEIFKYDLYSMKQFNGQMLLPTYLKYEVGRRIKCMEAKFFLVKTFEDGQQDEPVTPPATTLMWRFNNTELEAIDSREAPYGCDYVREWSDIDEYKVERPEFQLNTPQYIGQQSYHITRWIELYLEDHRVGDAISYIGRESFEQWYDAVAI